MFCRTVDLKKIYPEALADAPETLLVQYSADPSPEMQNVRVRPAMIVFAGGGYSYLSDRENEPICLEYLANGFTAFSLRYAVEEQYHYPVQMLQSAAAVRYIRTHAAELCVDPDKISVVGFSAGGHCAAMCAVLAREPKILDAFGAKPGELTPNAAVLCYAVLVGKYGHEGTFRRISGGDAALLDFLSLDKRVTKDTPPCFLFHTFEDPVVDVRNALEFASALRANGVSAELMISERGQHGISLADLRVNSDYPDSVDWVDRSVRFLRRHGLWL